jgi:hypothetical protein
MLSKLPKLLRMRLGMHPYSSEQIVEMPSDAPYHGNV